MPRIREKPGFRERLRVGLTLRAAQVIEEEGLSALQARRVADAAGCSVGTLYNIFGDIDALILAVNEATLQAIEQAMLAAMRRSAGADLETRLMALATTYLDFATGHQRSWRAVFEHRPPDDYGLPDSYVDARRRLLDMLDTELKTALPDRSAREDAAFALLWSVHGIVLLALDAKLRPFDPAACQRQIRFIVHNVAVGLD